MKPNKWSHPNDSRTTESDHTKPQRNTPSSQPDVVQITEGDDANVSQDALLGWILIGAVIAVLVFIAIFGLTTLIQLIMWGIALVMLAWTALTVHGTLNGSGDQEGGWFLAGCSFAVAALVWYFIPGSERADVRPAPPSMAAILALDERLASENPLPPEYRVLCEHVAIELKPSRDAYRNNKGPVETVAEGHASVMALRSIESDDPNIMYVSSHAQAAFTEALARMERINALPKPQGAGSLMVESFIHGLYGNVYQGYLLGVEASEKQKTIIAEVQPLMAAVDKADASQMILPTIAKQYAATPTENDGRIVIDIDESWGWFGPYDWFCMFNAGEQSLRDCTIQVFLTGKKGNARKNVHFIPHWPGNSWIYARYEPGEAILDRADAGKMTVTQIQKAEISVWSPTYSTSLTYVYQGAEKDKDIAEWCKDLKFSGAFQRHDAGILWDTQPGLKSTLDGVALIPKCRVDVTFRNALKSKSWYWEHERWENGDEKVFTKTKDKLDFIPDNVDMAVSFPDTSYRHETTLTVSP